MDINHNKVVYIHKWEHDDPHGLPQQQDLDGSTETSYTLNSHTASSSPEIYSFKKLEYIYQHFQDSEKIYESDPCAVRYTTNNTLYPHINNDIEYSLYEDVINSYYLDSQIKDDFKILWNYTILWITYIPLPLNGYGYECEFTNLATVHRSCISR